MRHIKYLIFSVIFGIYSTTALASNSKGDFDQEDDEFNRKTFRLTSTIVGAMVGGVVSETFISNIKDLFYKDLETSSSSSRKVLRFIVPAAIGGIMGYWFAEQVNQLTQNEEK